MILGHFAIAGITKRKFLSENFLFLWVASYGPDLIDKPASLVFNISGRGVGHSLLFFALLAVVTWCFCKRFNLNTQLVQIGGFLWLSHLAADFIDVQTFFWPMLGPFPDYPPSTLMERIIHYYILRDQVVQLSIEFSLIIIALILWLTYFSRQRIKSLDPLTGVRGQ
jgi:hypothetical protein